VVIFAELGVKKSDRLVTPGRCWHPHLYAVRPEIVSSRQGDASIPTLLHPSPAPTRVTTAVIRHLGDASIPTLLHPSPAPTRVTTAVIRHLGDASIPTPLCSTPAPTRVTTGAVTWVVTVAADPARIILLVLPR
jgi:hypothetical protein